MSTLERSTLPAPAFGDWRDDFCRYLDAGETVTQACKMVGKPRWSVYLAREESSVFAERWAAAREAGDEYKREHADHAMWARHVHGTDKPVFHKGEVCGHIREWDTTAGKAWLAAHDPRYRQYDQQPQQLTQQNTMHVTIAPEHVALVQRAVRAALGCPMPPDDDPMLPRYGSDSMAGQAAQANIELVEVTQQTQTHQGPRPAQTGGEQGGENPQGPTVGDSPPSMSDTLSGTPSPGLTTLGTPPAGDVS